jgi:trehalose-6-phosphate synthase
VSAVPKGVEWNGHMVAVDIFPAGIDPDVLEHTMEQPQVKKRVEELKKMVRMRSASCSSGGFWS